MDEFSFIDKLKKLFAGIGDETILGIGDDCAVVPVSADESFVVTTDMLVEGVHFLEGGISPRELGGKSLAVNLSDVAAMGARPVASFLSVALPADKRGGWAEEFARGYSDMSARFDVKPAGGDTTSSKGGVAINVTVVGRAPNKNLKYRSGARVGDVVAVTGFLGISAAANFINEIVPQVAEGAWLGERQEVGAMMDLSDGLAGDLVHILRASGVGAEVELTKIPTSHPLELALAGGEDYKLLLTASADGFEALAADYRERFESELYPVGRIIAGIPEIVWLENGMRLLRDFRGFDHFVIHITRLTNTTDGDAVQLIVIIL